MQTKLNISIFSNPFMLLMLFLATSFPYAASLASAQESTANAIKFGLQLDTSRNIIQSHLFSYGYFQGNYEKHWKNTELKADWDLRMGIPHYEANGVGSKNLYYGDQDSSKESPLRLSIGRRHLIWSEVDELWQLGQIQPLYAWDRLRPYSQGLTGVFGFTETQSFNFRFFASYLTLPEVNPNIIIKNGKFDNQHPQSISTAPQSIAALNVTTPLYYQLNLPSYPKILFRPSLAFLVETKPELPWVGRFSYGYLPLTYFPPALDGSLVISEVQANIVPRLMHHHVYSTDLGYQIGPWEAGAGAIVDQALKDHLDSQYNYSQIGTSTTLSPWLKYKGTHLKWNLAYLKTLKGLNGDVGSFTTPGQNLFSSHMFYREALMTSLQWEEPTHEALLITGKYLHELTVNGHWLMLDLTYTVSSHLTLLVGGDLIAATLSSAPDGGAEFLSDLRSNDRIRIGVTYAF